MPLWKLAPVAPRSVATALPERIVTNDELCAKLDCGPEWVESRTGIRERRFAHPDTDITELLARAGEGALAAAGLRPQDIDVVVVGSSSPEWLLPAMSVTVAARLGITTPRLLDLTQTACASAVYSIYTAAHLLQEPGLRHALVLGADLPSRVTDPDDPVVRVFFGDAAAATVLSRSEGAEPGLLSYDLGNSPDHAVHLASPHIVATRPPTNRYLQMNGRNVWQTATAVVPKSIHAALADANVGVDEVAAVAIHQANIRLIEHIVAELGIEPGRVPITADVLGNTASASPLTALHAVAQRRTAVAGDVLLLSAIGSGFLWGSLCFRLPADIAIKEA